MERHRQGSFSCSVLIMLTKYCSQSREMASNASSSRLTRPRKSDVSSRRRPFAEFSSVAGANAPAFVERMRSTALRACSTVSPELTLRPSLSDHCWSRGLRICAGVAGANAPAFVERVTGCWSRRKRSRSVAGANAPAFVERSMTRSCASDHTRVAGANAPAFVERPPACKIDRKQPDVSPELTLRPSLSASPRC